MKDKQPTSKPSQTKGKAGKAKGKTKSKFPYEYPALLLAIALALLTLMQFIRSIKWLIMLCSLLSAVICAVVLLRKRKTEKPGILFLCYGLYLLWLALEILWACSGKLFLREFSKQLYVLPLALFVYLLLPRRESSVRKLLFCLSAIGAFYAFFSIDVASAGLTRGMLSLIPGLLDADNGFEAGTRLTGIFSNGNISASIMAICFFLSLYLLESAENRRERIFAAVFAALQLNTFLLNFSLGATAFFLLSVVIYLIFAGKRRLAVFFHMFLLAVLVLITVFFSFRFFEVSDRRAVIPLIAAILNAAAAAVLELCLHERLTQALNERRKLATVVISVVLLLICVYAAAGLLIGGDAELTPGKTLRRTCYPSAGEYSLRITADGTVNVRIVSQNEQQVVMHTQSTLYSGVADNASFTVPEGSRVVYLTFSAKENATLCTAELEGTESISLHLGYPLLPGFIANRLQGLFANENAIQRAAFFRDGMKAFRDYPILGAGLGGFETLLFGYQDFFYETKYVHNHYIQVLLDSGIIGLLLYLSLLVLTALALWRARWKEGAFSLLHPALCAAFVMLVLHSTMEVVMSVTPYLPYACAVFALTAVCFPLRPLKKTAGKAATAIPGVVALAYTIMIVLNLQADSAVKNSTDNAARFFNSLEYAAKVDAFDKNDWMVSYINTCAELESGNYKPQADRYAQKLIDTPSNSLHQNLIYYYLTFGEYDNALLAAKKCAAFNASDSYNWNASFSSFASALSKYPADSKEILHCVSELNKELERYQEKLMSPIKLDDISKLVISAAENK